MGSTPLDNNCTCDKLAPLIRASHLSNMAALGDDCWQIIGGVMATDGGRVRIEKTGEAFARCSAFVATSFE